LRWGKILTSDREETEKRTTDRATSSFLAEPYPYQGETSHEECKGGNGGVGKEYLPG